MASDGGKAVKSNELAGFSNWQKWGPAVVERAPGQPGVYIFRLAESFRRLKGDSDLIYVGSGSLRNRLRNHLTGRGDVNRRLERVAREIGTLELAWRTHATAQEAKDNEGELLAVYDSEHLELPPLNRSESGRGKRAVIKMMLAAYPNLERWSTRELMQWLNGILDEVRKKMKETPRQ
jgi:excinuclease UvrABC nuclease subunit